MTPLLEVSHLSKTYPGQNRPCVNALSFQLEEGQILSLLGPSGHGKTTILKMIAGHEIPDAGEIKLSKTLLSGGGFFKAPQKRPVSMVFQDPALFSHLSVRDNILFGIFRLSTKEQNKRLDPLVDLFNISDLLERGPSALSGGQKQRVAMARTLITRPRLLLFDEPFSALDTPTRMKMREELISYLKELKMSSLFVLHDREDALSVSDFILLINRGEKVECAPPKELFEVPKKAWTADFLGSWIPIEGRAVGRDLVESSLFGPLKLQNPYEGKGPLTSLKLYLRPEGLRWHEGPYRATVEKLGPCAHLQTILLNKNGRPFRIVTPTTLSFKEWDEVAFDIDSAHLVLLQ
ncbi:MAG: ABC transporter ATP-binding protein [Bacteriovoracales bacterium]|nr:ABC transporter ATP-binding protein [Bacteriovoracales bacterium]